jgi:hypothetical protein
MSTRRTIVRAIALAAVATVVAACGDATAPTSTAVAPAFEVQPPSFDIIGFNVPVKLKADTTYASFLVKPWETNTFVFDRHSAITFPANASCRRDSSYGPTEWNKPCEPAAREMTISVKSYAGPDGHMKTDFSPALRFNPASAGVFLYLEDYENAVPLWSNNILYCNDLDQCVDESILDPTLRTFTDPATGLLGRRIKHFSGYSIGVGRSSEMY